MPVSKSAIKVVISLCIPEFGEDIRNVLNNIWQNHIGVVEYLTHATVKNTVETTAAMDNFTDASTSEENSGQHGHLRTQL